MLSHVVKRDTASYARLLRIEGLMGSRNLALCSQNYLVGFSEVVLGSSIEQ